MLQIYIKKSHRSINVLENAQLIKSDMVFKTQQIHKCNKIASHSRDATLFYFEI